MTPKDGAQAYRTYCERWRERDLTEAKDAALEDLARLMLAIDEARRGQVIERLTLTTLAAQAGLDPKRVAYLLGESPVFEAFKEAMLAESAQAATRVRLALWLGQSPYSDQAVASLKAIDPSPRTIACAFVDRSELTRGVADFLECLCHAPLADHEITLFDAQRDFPLADNPVRGAPLDVEYAIYAGTDEDCPLVLATRPDQLAAASGWLICEALRAAEGKVLFLRDPAAGGRLETLARAGGEGGSVVCRPVIAEDPHRLGAVHAERTHELAEMVRHVRDLDLDSPDWVTDFVQPHKAGQAFLNLICLTHLHAAALANAGGTN